MYFKVLYGIQRNPEKLGCVIFNRNGWLAALEPWEGH